MLDATGVMVGQLMLRWWTSDWCTTGLEQSLAPWWRGARSVKPATFHDDDGDDGNEREDEERQAEGGPCSSLNSCDPRSPTHQGVDQ